MISGQLQLPGLDAQVVPTDNLFFAFLPDVQAQVRIHHCAQALRTRHRLAGKPLAQERLHITLFPLGHFPEMGIPPWLLPETGAVAATVAAASSCFDIVLTGIQGHHGGAARHAVMMTAGPLENGALREFQQFLARSLLSAGIQGLKKYRFAPHLTLLYDQQNVLPDNVEPIRWTARELVLVRSFLGQSRYEFIQRWPLRPLVEAWPHTQP